MNKKQIEWPVSMLVVAAVGAACYWAGTRGQDPVFPARDAASMDVGALDAELAQIRDAEKIEDPYTRCMAYPTPPEFDWPSSLVEATCKRLQRSMLGSKDIEQALDAHRANVLDQTFEGYLAKNGTSPDQHGYLIWTYWWMFQSSSKWTEDVTSRWVGQSPGSAYALAARGIHYSQAAWDARGGKSYADTPAERLARMRGFCARARDDLQAALARNPRLIAAYHGLLRIAPLADDVSPEQRDDWVRQALALDPQDQWIYGDWMFAVEPEWGGSLTQMNRVAEQAAQHAQDNPTLLLLRAEPLCQQANRYRCDSCDKDGAKSLDLFRHAGAFGPSACFLDGAGAAAVLAQDLPAAVRYYSQAYRFLGRDEWLAYRAQNLRSLGRGDWAMQNLTAALARHPDNTTLLYALALAYADANRSGDAERTYRAMLEIEPANQTAMIELARLYLTVLKTPDKARPLVDALLRADPTLPLAWYEGDAVRSRRRYAGLSRCGRALPALRQPFRSVAERQYRGDQLAFAAVGRRHDALIGRGKNPRCRRAPPSRRLKANRRWRRGTRRRLRRNRDWISCGR